MILIKILFSTFLEIKQASPFKEDACPFWSFFLPLTFWRLIGFYWNFEGVWIEYKLTLKTFFKLKSFLFDISFNNLCLIKNFKPYFLLGICLTSFIFVGKNYRFDQLFVMKTIIFTKGGG